MKGITTRPEVRAERYYTTAEAVRILEMERTSFWRAVKRGELRHKFQPKTFRKLFQGKELLKFWQKNLMPI